MLFIAEELREYMSKLGVRTVDELVGRSDLPVSYTHLDVYTRQLQERDEEAIVGILIRARQYTCRICSSRT